MCALVTLRMSFALAVVCLLASGCDDSSSGDDAGTDSDVDTDTDTDTDTDADTDTDTDTCGAGTYDGSFQIEDQADLEELKRYIYTTGFYTNKARAIKNSARQILNDFQGRIPRRLEELVKLSGVGRKTGSVILGAGYNRAEGIVVDTHVGRISRKLGFTKNKDAVRVEKDLMRIIPPKDWIVYSHLLIDHGRSVCRARRPDCQNCFLNKLCPAAELT